MKKTKKKKTNHEKAVERMNREVNRAVAHVEMLKQLYTELKNTNK